MSIECDAEKTKVAKYEYYVKNYISRHIVLNSYYSSVSRYLVSTRVL